jgi:TolB protein
MPNGRIVFKGCDYTLEPQQCGLYGISSAGGPWTKLTDNGEDSAPAGFGDKIVFMSTRHGNWELYSINQDGTGLRRLTNDAAHDGLPAWAPGGKTVAFVSNRGGTWAIWAMSPDGSNQRKMFDIGDGGLVQEWEKEQISWAP